METFIPTPPAPDLPEETRARVRAARVRVLDAEQAHRDALAQFAEVVREEFQAIRAAGWEPAARAIGTDEDGVPLVSESTLRQLTRDLTMKARATRRAAR